MSFAICSFDQQSSSLWEGGLVSLETWGPRCGAAQEEGGPFSLLQSICFSGNHTGVILTGEKKSRQWYNHTLLLARSPPPAP